MTRNGTEPEAVLHTDGELRWETGSRSGEQLGRCCHTSSGRPGPFETKLIPRGPGGLNELVQEEIPRGQACSPADL